MTEPYDYKTIELSSQQYWHEQRTFHVNENSDKDKFYCLSMLPYPSGNLHMGHVRNYTIGDVASRYQRLLGKNVLQPMGWDAFGLPAENAALKHKVSPDQWTKSNIKHMKEQLQRLGYGYDWSREITTCNPEYYRWEQWLFTQLLEKDLVYRKKTAVNWDPVDQTILANEQVIDGKGWRSGATIERKEISQWFLKITDYADELLDSLDDLHQWPESVRNMQRNWIGRSHGTTVKFTIDQDEQTILDIFTTRADTLMGVSFIAIAPEHQLAKICAQENTEIQTFIDSCQHTKVAEAELATLDKKGVATPLYAIHPLTKKKIPIWIANFILADYGSGAVMGVPAHDSRDHEFATQYHLTIPPVIQAPPDWDYSKAAYSDEASLINSGEFDGMSCSQAKQAITNQLEANNLGHHQVQYRLRDWGVSRQRYWGCPIPVQYDQQGNYTPIDASQLPVSLPTDVTLNGPKSPLSEMPSFSQTTHPETGEACTRETDTFDTFVESSWYYLRYCCPDQNNSMLDQRADYWAPVDLYIGGIEHAIMHLLYARFMHKVLRDLGLIHSDEPFQQLLTQGMVLNKGEKMSKSKGNTVDPNELIEQYGADTLRFFTIFAAPPEQSFEWSEGGVEGSHRFLKRLWHVCHDQHEIISTAKDENPDWNKLAPELKSARFIIHKTIEQASIDMEKLQLNTVASACMKILNALIKTADIPGSEQVIYEGLHHLLIILNPIAPHITHHLWQYLGYGDDIITASWPQADAHALGAQDQITLVVQINGKRRGELEVKQDSDQDTLMQLIQDCDNLNKYIQDKTIVKTIVVPNKLINLVIK